MEHKTSEKSKSSRKKKTLSLVDFIVKKPQKSDEKSPAPSKRKIAPKKVIASVYVKRGKVKKKKPTTLKKKILKIRNVKKEKMMMSRSNDGEESETQSDEDGDDDQSRDEAVNDHQQVVSATPPTAATDEVLNIVDKLARIAVVKSDEPPSISADAVPVVAATPSLPPCISSGVQHSRNFRDYCNHFITDEIRSLTEQILASLLKFQDNKFHENPTRAKSHKRYVVGFKEVRKFLVVGRLKLVIIAPDLEKNAEVDGLVDDLKSLAADKSIPLLFSIKRRKIGYILLKKVPVSCVGVFDYQGVHERVQELLSLVDGEKINYQQKISIDDRRPPHDA